MKHIIIELPPSVWGMIVKALINAGEQDLAEVIQEQANKT